MLGVYVHLPFCERKCNYCAFISFTNIQEQEENYVNHLLEEIEQSKNKYFEGKKEKIDTIYLGGGTPSIVKLENIEKILDAIKNNFYLSENNEITIECNPNSLDTNKLKFYKKVGINRLSIGVQTLDDKDLKIINRLHTSEQAIDVVRQAREVGFENISVDLLIGLKNQTKENFIKQIEVLKILGVKHFSCYMIQVENGTKLEQLYNLDKNIILNEDESVDIYEKTADFFNKSEFLRYEISNFAVKGFESKHNYKYWTGENYIGFGVAAHSYINGIRYANPKNFSQYYLGENISKEVLTKKQIIEEHIMLGFRCNNGVNIPFLNSLGYDITQNSDYKFMKEKNIIIEKNDKVYLNPNYYGVNNFIIVKLLP